MSLRIIFTCFLLVAMTTTITSAKQDPRCPVYVPGSEAYHFPHETDCRKFYKCAMDGVAVLMACQRGLEFDPILSVCSWPQGNCNSLDALPQLPYAPEVDQPPPPPSPSAPVNPGYCPPNENPQYPTHLPHPTDCSKFFKCSEGLPYEISCPPGQHWSIHNNYCDYTYLANCVRPLQY